MRTRAIVGLAALVPLAGIAVVGAKEGVQVLQRDVLPRTVSVDVQVDGVQPRIRPPARAEVVTVPGTRSTTVLLTVDRPPGADAVRYAADFDGSGGGEAVVVTCTERRAAAEDASTIGLHCDRYVAPWQLDGLAFVRVSAAR